MTKYAIVSIGDKQYKVSEGLTLEVQKLSGANGTVTFDQVLLVADGDKIEVGTPTVPGMTVSATFVEDKKGEKVQVFQYKSKSKYRKLRGARQTYSYLKIDAIGQPAKKTEAKPAAKKPETKKTTGKKAAK